MLPGLVMLTLLLDSDPFPPLRIIDRYCFISNRSITALLEKLFVCVFTVINIGDG